MVHYVHNAKKRGLNKKEMADNLRKAKWSSEQIAYVMKKYAGERTGMFEIPITKLFSNPGAHEGHPGYHGEHRY